jgi:cell division protein ZapA (FtsZ GTPase activity inhibitor)
MSTLPEDEHDNLVAEVRELNEIIADVREIFSEYNSEDVRVMAQRASEDLTRLRLMETATVQGLRRQVHDLEQKLAYANSGPHGDCQG